MLLTGKHDFSSTAVYCRYTLLCVLKMSSTFVYLKKEHYSVRALWMSIRDYDEILMTKSLTASCTLLPTYRCIFVDAAAVGICIQKEIVVSFRFRVYHSKSEKAALHSDRWQVHIICKHSGRIREYNILLYIHIRCIAYISVNSIPVYKSSRRNRFRRVRVSVELSAMYSPLPTALLYSDDKEWIITLYRVRFEQNFGGKKLAKHREKSISESVSAVRHTCKSTQLFSSCVVFCRSSAQSAPDTYIIYVLS